MKWPMARLDDVIDFIRGITFKPTDVVPPFTHDSIVVMRTKNVQVEGLDCSDLISVPRHFMKREEQRLKDGDLLISSANSWELVGKTSFVEKLDYDATAGGFISIVRAKKNKVDPKYLYYWLVTPETQLTIRHLGKQTTNISNLDVARFKRLEIPLPPLKEQKRIATILDKADAIRQKRQQAIALADDFLRSVFLDMFGDPVTNPKGWVVKPLGKDIIHANNGLARRRKDEDNVGDIVLRLQDVHYDGIHFDKELNRIALDDKEKARYKIDAGDILFIRVNGNPDYVGRSAVFNGHTEDVYHNDHIIRIKVSSSFEPKFLSYVFNSHAGRRIIAKKTKTSAGQHTISQGGIEELTIYRPPLEKQKSFVKIMNALMSMIENSFKSDGLNVGLFAALSQKAFTGQL